MSDKNTKMAKRHWSKTRNLTFLILILWFVFSMLIPWNAEALNKISFLNFPLGYYMCVQGSLLVFVLLIFFQNWRQDAIDDEYAMSEHKVTGS